MVEFGLGIQTEELRVPCLNESLFEDFGL